MKSETSARRSIASARCAIPDDQGDEHPALARQPRRHHCQDGEHYGDQRHAGDRVDSTTETAYEIEMDLPGIKPADMTIEVRGQELWLTGDASRNERKRGGPIIGSSRSMAASARHSAADVG